VIPQHYPSSSSSSSSESFYSDDDMAMTSNRQLGSMMYDGIDSRKMIHYQRDRINCRGSIFKERALTILDHINHNGANTSLKTVRPGSPRRR
jgi:hypothetical protein